MCLWNVGICHYGMLTESNFWSWLSWTHILYINVYLHGTNVVFLNGCFLTFWFFSSLGLLSRLMWPLFHVTSKTPLYLQLRKVSMSPLDRLSDFCPVCSPMSVVSLCSPLSALQSEHHSLLPLSPQRVWHSRKHLLSENLHLRNFRPSGKNRVGGYENPFITL